MIGFFLVISYLSLFSLGLCDNIRGPLFVDILNHYNLNNFVGSWVFAGSSFFALLGSASVRYFFKYLHPYRVLQFSLVLMCLGFLVMGLASSFQIFMIGVLVFGFSVGLVGVAQNYLVSVGCLPEHRSRALSGLHAMYALASLGAPFVVRFLSQWQLPWASALLWVSTVPVIVFLISIFLSNKNDFARTVPHSKVPLISNRFDRRMIMVSLILGFYVVAEILLSSRLAALFRTEFGSDLQQSSDYLMIFFFLFFLGRLAFFFIKFSWPIRKILFYSHFLSIVFFVLGLWVSPYYLILCGLSMAPFYPLAVSLISEMFPHRVGQAIAWTMSIQSMLIVVMHLLVGLISDLYGLKLALNIGLFCCLASAALLLTLKTHKDPSHES